MKAFAFTPLRPAVVHLFVVLLALVGLSSAQQKSASIRPAGTPAPGTLPPPATNYNFQTLAAPSGASSTYAQGINSNGTLIAGGYWPASGENSYGLVYSKSQMTVLTYPGAAQTRPTAINDKGVVIGNYGPGGSASAGFVYENGQYKTVPIDAEIVGLTAISDSNAIVELFVPRNQKLYHCVLAAKGVRTKISFPGSLFDSTSGSGVNESGEVVGTYANDSGYFGFTDVNGTYTSFQVPGAALVNTAAISNNGNIAGTYQDSSNIQHGYVLINGQFTTIDYPGATYTEVLGIDDAGDVVGTYYQGPCTLSGQNCGFLATVQ
jgi:uncharacterized membrane protein